MPELDDKQWDSLRELHKLATLADMEADAAMYADSLDDARAAIEAVVTASGALTLPNGLAAELQAMAQEALKATDGEDDAQKRATQAMTAVEGIEQTIQAHFIAAGRKL